MASFAKRAKKIEPPRPLKPKKLLEDEKIMRKLDLLKLIGKTVDQLKSGIDNEEKISLMVENLRQNGIRLESDHKDVLDAGFEMFKQASNDERLSLGSRCNLHELVELRLKKWVDDRVWSPDMEKPPKCNDDRSAGSFEVGLAEQQIVIDGNSAIARQAKLDEQTVNMHEVALQKRSVAALQIVEDSEPLHNGALIKKHKLSVTIVVGEHSMELTGYSHNLLRLSKTVLDDYFKQPLYLPAGNSSMRGAYDSNANQGTSLKRTNRNHFLRTDAIPQLAVVLYEPPAPIRLTRYTLKCLKSFRYNKLAQEDKWGDKHNFPVMGIYKGSRKNPSHSIFR